MLERFNLSFSCPPATSGCSILLRDFRADVGRGIDCTELFVSIAPLNTAWLQATDRSLLGAAYDKARAALQEEANLSDGDLDALSGVITFALVSLIRTGQTDQNKLSHYGVAQALRHLWAERR
jgi:hypothetical protein